MAKFRKPFLKKSLAAWYVQLEGKQVRPAETEAEAFERYHERMATRKKAARFVTPPASLPRTPSAGSTPSSFAPKFCLYHFRHSWLDRMLKAGVDALTCAVLMGRRDPSMVASASSELTPRVAGS